jgi:hypothetical protein
MEMGMLINYFVVKKVDFVRDRMLCIILGGSWCDTVVLNVHAPLEDRDKDRTLHLSLQVPQYITSKHM